jgi:hypothetical protein
MFTVYECQAGNPSVSMFPDLQHHSFDSFAFFAPIERIGLYYYPR